MRAILWVVLVIVAILLIAVCVFVYKYYNKETVIALSCPACPAPTVFAIPGMRGPPGIQGVQGNPGGDASVTVNTQTTRKNGLGQVTAVSNDETVAPANGTMVSRDTTSGNAVVARGGGGVVSSAVPRSILGYPARTAGGAVVAPKAVQFSNPLAAPHMHRYPAGVLPSSTHSRRSARN